MNEVTYKLAVLTATFNSAAVINILIGSLKAQSNKNFVWVVVDGASSDSTLEIVKSVTEFPVVLISEPDFGIYDALNKGVKACDADYYLVAGSDDRFHPEAIENYLAEIKSNDVDLVSAKVLSGTTTLLPGRGMSWLRGQNAYISNHSLGVAIRCDLHQQFGLYSRKFPIAADQLFIKRVCMSDGVRVKYAAFLAGEFSEEGVSSVDIAGLLSEIFRVQLLTERFRGGQVLIYLLRLIKNWRKMV